MMMIGGFFVYSFCLFALGMLSGALLITLASRPSPVSSAVDEDSWLFQPRLELIVDNTPKDAA